MKNNKNDRFDLWHLEIFEYNRNKLIIKCCVPKSDSYSSLKRNLFSNLQHGNISLSATKWARKMKKMCYNIISRITFNPQQKKYKFLPAKKTEREREKNSHEPKPMVNEGNEQFSFSWCLCLKSHKSFIKKWNWIDRLNYKSLKFTVFFIIIWCEKKKSGRRWRKRNIFNGSPSHNKFLDFFVFEKCSSEMSFMKKNSQELFSFLIQISMIYFRDFFVVGETSRFQSAVIDQAVRLEWIEQIRKSSRGSTSQFNFFYFDL